MSPVQELRFHSLGELNREVEVNLEKWDATCLVKSARKLLLAAKKEELKNMEQSYIHYMRYFRVVEKVKKSPEYSQSRNYFDSMLPRKDAMQAVDRAEKLQQKLEVMYSEKIRKKRDDELKQKLTTATKMATDLATAAALAPVSPVEEIMPIDIRNLIKQRCTSFLLLDVRPESDFNDTCINSGCSVNIDSNRLSAGMTSRSIELCCPSAEHKSQWRRRADVDRLILLDWDSDLSNVSRHLSVVLDALLKWNVDDTPVKKPLHLLKGGLDMFLLQYPMNVKNPDKARAIRKKATQISTEHPSLSDIVYPDLDEAFIASPSSVSQPDRASSFTPPTGGVPDSEASVSGPVNGLAKATATLPPMPDRKTKPYLPPPPPPPQQQQQQQPRLSLEADANDTLNATTFSDVLGSEQPSISSSTSSLLNKAMLESSDLACHEDASTKPTIDRSLKAKALLSMDKPKLQQVLEAQGALIEDSIMLERKALDLEDNWQLLRLQREKSAEQEMKLEVMKKEETLMLALNRLHDEKASKEAENKWLKEQLEQLRRRIERDTESKAKLDDEAHQERLEVELKNQRLEKEIRQLRVDVSKKREARQAGQLSSIDGHKPDPTIRRLNEAMSRIARVDPDAPVAGSSPMSALSRSHSSPNIAQMLDDDEDEGSMLIQTRPQVNRSSKPVRRELSEARMRDFKPIWTTKPSYTGLKNLGNTCYMNSIVQCLSNFTLLFQYFTSNNYQQWLNSSSATRGEIAIEFAAVVETLRSGQYKSISPLDFKLAIGKYKNNFSGHDQQDAHELLVTLMEWLHNDVNEIRTKVTLQEQENAGVPEVEAAQRAWAMEQQVDRSFIRELFYGQWRSTLRCLTCGWKSVKYEAFFELALPLPTGNGKCSLSQCIEAFLREETVNYTCPKCSRARDCAKKFEIVKLPGVLTIQLVRFYNDGLWRKKQNFVDFGLERVHFGKYALACGGTLNRYADYNLVAVCNHFGSMEGGHYTAYCFSEHTSQWLKYDDHEVSEIRTKEVCSTAAYVLFYEFRPHKP